MRQWSPAGRARASMLAESMTGHASFDKPALGEIIHHCPPRLSASACLKALVASCLSQLRQHKSFDCFLLQPQISFCTFYPRTKQTRIAGRVSSVRLDGIFLPIAINFSGFAAPHRIDITSRLPTLRTTTTPAHRTDNYCLRNTALRNSKQQWLTTPSMPSTAIPTWRPSRPVRFVLRFFSSLSRPG